MNKESLQSDPVDAARMIDRFAGRFPAHVMRRIRTPEGLYRYLHVSPGVQHSFGLDPAQLLAQDSVTHEWVHPEDRPGFLEALETSARDLTTLDEEIRLLLPDGTIRWVRSLGDPQRLADGTVMWDGVALDVSERREAMQLVARAMDAARTAEASASGVSTQMFRDVANPVAALRQALFPGAEGADIGAARAALMDIEEALGLSAPGPIQKEAAPHVPVLTRRQTELATLVSRGLSNRDMAAQLGLSEGTVKLHISAILRRLGLRNRTEIAQRVLGGISIGSSGNV